MKKIIIVLKIVFLSFLFSDEFILENNLIEISINDELVKYPFLGGFNQPKIQWIDWDFDGDTDLFLKDEGNHLRYYDNIGTPDQPDFILKSTNFKNLQIGNWFIFNDFDNDGDYDLATQNINIQIGSYTAIAYYINDEMNFILGSSSLSTNNNEIVFSELVSTPTFTDIDNDGDLDFFSGNSSNGSLTYYENIGHQNSIPIFSYITNFWEEITIIGGLNQRHGASAITFIDLDGDSDLDLSWGDYFQQSLYIIWNIGDAYQPIMDIENIITEYPDENPIDTAGQNMPTFADLDNDNDNDLFVTVLFGAYGTQYVNNFYHYKNNGSLSNPIYEFITSDYLSTLDFYTDSSPTFSDIDNDGDLDFFIGTEIDYSTFPFRGRIKYFKNIGNINNPIFELVDPYFLGTNIGTNLSPVLIDIDNDNDNDIFVGEWNGKIKFFKNNGTPENFNFDYVGELEAIDENNNIEIIDLSGRSSPRFIDIDNDGDFDLFIGTVSGNISYYENIGNRTNYEFSFITHQYSQIEVVRNSKPDFVDIDNDNDYDLLVGSESMGVNFFRNIGSGDSAIFIVDSTYKFVDGQNIAPVVCNLFSIDTLDAIFGLSTGGIFHAQLSLCNNGDINNDQNIDIFDLNLIIDSILFNEPILTEIFCKADIDNNDDVNIFDIIMIIQIILDS